MGVCAARRTWRSARWTTTGSAGRAIGPAAPGRLDRPLTRVRASGARNEGHCVGVPSPPLLLPNSDGTLGALHPQRGLPSLLRHREVRCVRARQDKECRLLQWSPRAVRNKKPPGLKLAHNRRTSHSRKCPIDHRLRASDRVERHPLAARDSARVSQLAS